tara:strand:- start:145 stop:321 length:177 start_codon:yes stop_codon:yes gene_type:complete
VRWLEGCGRRPVIFIGEETPLMYVEILRHVKEDFGKRTPQKEDGFLFRKHGNKLQGFY